MHVKKYNLYNMLFVVVSIINLIYSKHLTVVSTTFVIWLSVLIFNLSRVSRSPTIYTLKMKVRFDMRGYTNLFTNTVEIPDHNRLVVKKVFPHSRRGFDQNQNGGRIDQYITWFNHNLCSQTCRCHFVEKKKICKLWICYWTDFLFSFSILQTTSN
jgi:hypothetical protein